MAAAMFGGVLVGVDAAAPAIAADAVSARDEASATALARSTGREIEILDQISQTRRAWAQPDGSVRVQMHLTPERVKDSAGAWRNVDLTLERRPDGTVRPKVDAHGLVLSGGRGASTDDLVTLGAGTERSELGWRGALPQPRLEGNKATYVEVKPGVDLIVEATATGFEYFLLLKSRSAAASLGQVSMPWRTGDLRPVRTAQGAIELRAADGEAAAVLPMAEMWDASVSPVTLEHYRRAPVAMETTGNAAGGVDLVLRPEASFFDRPDVTWPVTIDPAVTKTANFDAFVQNTYTSDQSGSGDLKLGYIVDPDGGCSSPCKARSFLSFHDLNGYDGSTVVSAELFLWNYHSWSCTAAGWEAWRTSYVTSTVRWTNQPTWAEKDGTSSGTKGYNSSCADGWVSVSVKKTFQNSFNSSSTTTANVGIRATNEGSNYGWKRFRSANYSSNRPYVSFTYNRKPNTPTSMSITDCSTQCSSPALVSRKDPELRVLASDPDGGTLTINFQVYDSSSSSPVRTGSKTGYPSGSSTPAAWRISPALTTDGWYKWRAQACDSGGLCSSWTGYFEFTTDSEAPAPPDVDPVDPALYFEDDGSGASSGGIGVPGQLLLAGGAEVSYFKWSLDGGGFSPNVPASGTNPRTATITVTPLMDMIRVVTVEAYDGFGRKGTKTYRFNVSSPDPEAARFWLDGTGDNELSDNDAAPTGVTWVDGHLGIETGQAAHVGGSGRLATPYPVLATAPNPADAAPRSFSVSAWVRLSDTNGYRTAVGQAGSQKAMFELGYQAGGFNNWCFSIFHADSSTAAATRACATGAVLTDTWVHLAGVFDAVNNNVYLYVNGGSNLFGETVVLGFTGTPFSATGSFLIGTGWHAAAPGAQWVGDIDDVLAFQRALPEEEIQVQALS